MVARKDNPMQLRSLAGGLFSIITLIAFGAPPHTEASESFYRSELTGGVDSTAGFVRINVGTASYVQYSLTGSYAYSLTRQFQIGFQGAISDSGAPLDAFRYSVYLPFSVNWGGEDLRDDYFGRVAPGISYYNAVNFALLMQLGKRFKIFDNFSWRPTVGVVANFGNGAARVAFDIIPVAFSLIF
jgi:hypothetical protein